jgi:hypothetical protein
MRWGIRPAASTSDNIRARMGFRNIKQSAVSHPGTMRTYPISVKTCLKQTVVQISAHRQVLHMDAFSAVLSPTTPQVQCLGSCALKHLDAPLSYHITALFSGYQVVDAEENCSCSALHLAWVQSSRAKATVCCRPADLGRVLKLLVWLWSTNSAARVQCVNCVKHREVCM